ncbi:hypothetical protein HQN87_18465 [Paenibacillus tritici]|uniref:Uncharacterized protein n=1 Tax=Paenibacillus tritici TaxID=1873425 RepID=A0ABX2DRL1_9BACL|nr:hypothetical protein [Paenibacillus tritici]
MNSNPSGQIRECEQIIQQLMAQTQQGTQLYQQMLQQEQQDAAKLQELSQHNNKAIQMIQQAMQGHQTAMQQMQQILQTVKSLEQFPQTTGFNTSDMHRMNPEHQSFGTGIQSSTGMSGFNSGSMNSSMGSGNSSMGSMNSNMGSMNSSMGSGSIGSSFSPSFTSGSQPVNPLHRPMNSFNPQPMHTPMSAGSSFSSPMNQGRSFQQ